jgi:RNA polymerase sigma-70 factor (ECF subfamily)
MGVDARPRSPAEPLTFAACFHELFPRVARTAVFVARDPALGPDIAQEAFSRLYERWDRMESPEHARNFVYRVAVNLARSHLRRRIAAPFGLVGPEGSEPDRTARSDDWLVLADALQAVSPRQRTCLVLVDYAGLDIAEVAEVLGMQPGTVRMHLTRGRRTLRDRLSIPLEER